MILLWKQETPLNRGLIEFTFRAVHFGHGCTGKVSINNIQKEVSWVVVGLTGITWNTRHKDQCLITITFAVDP